MDTNKERAEEAPVIIRNKGLNVHRKSRFHDYFEITDFCNLNFYNFLPLKCKIMSRKKKNPEAGK